MKRILVPLDGSDFAETALPTARALVERFDGELHLASIVSDLPPVPLASGDGELVGRWFKDEEARAARYLEEVRQRLQTEGGPGVEVHVRTGPVARSLDALAEEREIDLFVLTTHGRGAWQRAWLGSVSDALVRRAGRPLLLLRDPDGSREWKAGTPARVVVPLDGSAPAESALEALVPLIDAERTALDLVMVIHEPFPLATTYLPHALSEGHLLEVRKERAGEYLEGVRARLAGEGLRVETHVVMADDAARGVLRHLESAGADLVALATRGRGSAVRFALGSVADKVIRGADMPALVSRRRTED